MAATKDLSKIFAERLRLARELRHFSQRKLAAETRLPPTSITHFEAGTRKPAFDSLGRLANALHVTTDYLLGRAEDPAVAQTDDPLFRDVSRLTAVDRELARDFLQMLVDRNKSKRGE